MGVMVMVRMEVGVREAEEGKEERGKVGFGELGVGIVLSSCEFFSFSALSNLITRSLVTFYSYHHFIFLVRGGMATRRSNLSFSLNLGLRVSRWRGRRCLSCGRRIVIVIMRRRMIAIAMTMTTSRERR